ncbi:GNAT family N-acetyltransferase [Leifsonia shinshuensis]|uniref:GNAT family N-acetyltransferase n=1 Tax=Leifsonia shinshuensis TaxID=150026 RepID=A0A7G6YBZ3_9MICO|nr:GNAT family N-acetyltransferase [Leifsonia shinshuensis]QNE36008.1 GNAT family N-acetyltransferase [Leifsonia shinshuensis]
MTDADTTAFTIRPLDPTTWDAFAALCDRHAGGGFGGCYCTWFHGEKHSAPDSRPERPAGSTKELKHDLVLAGDAHAALVFDGDLAVGWAQFGSPEELPGIRHRKEYLETTTSLPDYRITCVFVDRQYRGRGVGRLAIAGALDLIAAAGGGVVEGYPRDDDKRVAPSFLYSMTRRVFEDAGFDYDRPKGTVNCVMRTTVAAR